jgi:hypothetical protein
MLHHALRAAKFCSVITHTLKKSGVEGLGLCFILFSDAALAFFGRSGGCDSGGLHEFADVSEDGVLAGACWVWRRGDDLRLQELVTALQFFVLALDRFYTVDDGL